MRGTKGVAARQLASGKWQALYRVPGKSWRSVGTFINKTDALKAAQRKSAEVMLGTWEDPRTKREGITFAEFGAKFLERKEDARKAPKTLADIEATLRNHLNPYFGPMFIEDITREHVQEWVGRMRRRGAEGTTPKAYRWLRAILNDAFYSKRIEFNPALRVDIPKFQPREGVAITPNDIFTIASHIEERYQTLVCLAGFMGLRWAECAGLRVSDLDLRQGSMTIRVTNSEVAGKIHLKERKTGKILPLSLPNFLCSMLNAHIARFPSKDGWVFTSPKGGVLRRDVYPRFYKPAVTAAGLPELQFRDLRVSASSIVQSPTHGGESVGAAQKMLGHASPKITTEVYTKQFPEDIEAARAALERVFQSSELGAEVVAQLSRGDEGKIAAIGARSAREAV